MALIKCPECGREISDKAESCPGCGCPRSELVQDKPEDTRSEFDRIVDEIFWEKPNAFLKNAKILSKRVCISRKEAEDIMYERWKLWKKDKKQGMFPDDQYCPCCGSQDIMSYQDPGISVTDYNKGFKAFITMTGPSTTMMRCNTCRHKWMPRRKKRG